MRPSTAGGQPAPPHPTGRTPRLTAPHKVQKLGAVLGISSAIGAHLRASTASRLLMSCVALTTKNVRLHFAPPMPAQRKRSRTKPPNQYATSASCPPLSRVASVVVVDDCLLRSKLLLHGSVFTSSLCLSDIRHQCRAVVREEAQEDLCGCDVLFADPDQRRPAAPSCFFGPLRMDSGQTESRSRVATPTRSVRAVQ